MSLTRNVVCWRTVFRNVWMLSWSLTFSFFVFLLTIWTIWVRIIEIFVIGVHICREGRDGIDIIPSYFDFQIFSGFPFRYTSNDDIDEIVVILCVISTHLSTIVVALPLLQCLSVVVAEWSISYFEFLKIFSKYLLSIFTTKDFAEFHFYLFMISKIGSTVNPIKFIFDIVGQSVHEHVCVRKSIVSFLVRGHGYMVGKMIQVSIDVAIYLELNDACFVTVWVPVGLVTRSAVSGREGSHKFRKLLGKIVFSTHGRWSFTLKRESFLGTW